ncbi:MAG: TlpA family protein disulfide reductase [Bacteroidales bacterium]|nr:TlpA family protein disulfide reductase [Bacteroidales bacterium]
MKRILIFLTVIIFSLDSYAEKCVISGNAATYSGDRLELFTYSDYITKTRIKIAGCIVAEDGYFVFEFNSDKTFQAFINLNVFLGKIIIEPGKKIEIVLPKKTVRNEADILNPYFKQIEFYIRVLNEDNNITNAINKFNRLYNESFDVIFKDPKHINSGLVEQELMKISDSLQHIDNKFFEDYKFYKFLHLRQLSYYKNKEAVIRKNYSSKDVLYDNPAYNDLLIEEFGTFMFEENGDTLYKILSTTKDWRSINNFLANNEKYNNKDFREYFLSLSLYKLFYRNNIYQRSIINILKTAGNSGINDHTKSIIRNILGKTETLIVGSPVLDFTIYNQYKESISLSDFSGDFIYLSFFTKDSYTCQKDIILLSQLQKKNIDLLTIITVFKDPNHQDIIDLSENNNYDWTILHCYDKDKILKDYKVVAYPTYYLIHPEGTLSLMPAPGPAEDFEAEYFKIYKEYQRKLTRDNN